MKFNPTAAQTRLDKFWRLPTLFGKERNVYRAYLEEIISDRYQLVNGLQLLRDELQFASDDHRSSELSVCGVDLSVPSVCTTVCFTNCGDRIHQGGPLNAYQQAVGARFATLSEIGELKIESFSPTGGGTDDGATLAHVTVAHQLDEPLRQRMYAGHDQTFVLAAFDLSTHVGRHLHADGRVEFGLAQESKWREPRAACGAIVGTLRGFNADNPVHRRLRRDLGEQNFQFLTQHGVRTPDGCDVTAAVAASIVAIQGMLNTAAALTTELDERGVGHLTACVGVNRVAEIDTVIYLARATVFGGKVRVQGLGTDALKYSARLIVHSEEDERIVLVDDGVPMGEHPIREIDYPPRMWAKRENQIH